MEGNAAERSGWCGVGNPGKQLTYQSEEKREPDTMGESHVTMLWMRPAFGLLCAGILTGP